MEGAQKKEFGLEEGFEKAATEDLAKIREEVAKLKEAADRQAKENIATQIASHFPLSVRKAKFDEIMKSSESLDILKAKLAAIESLNSTKLASGRKIDLNVINPAKATIFNEGSAQRHASMPVADLTDI
jgi:hypothetical protein